MNTEMLQLGDMDSCQACEDNIRTLQLLCNWVKIAGSPEVSTTNGVRILQLLINCSG
jgi:hypothetical protein